MTQVLIFESDHAFALELRTELSRLGCAIRVFSDGDSGLSSAAAEPPDIILLSVELPRVNGFSVCNKLRRDKTLRSIPLVIMSSESSDETFEQHKTLPTRADDYLHKPITASTLIGRMQQLVPLTAVEPLLDEQTSLVLDSAGETPAVRDPAAATAATMLRPRATLESHTTEYHPDLIYGARPGDAEVPSGRPSAPAETSLFDEDEDEKTRLTDQDALGSAGRTASTPAPDAAIAHQLLERMRAELLASRREIEQANTELGKVRGAATEAGRLRQQLDETRRHLTATESDKSALGREILELRETLQQRDKDLLAAREQAAAEQRQSIETRDESLAAERAASALKERVAELEAVERAHLELQRSTADLRTQLAEAQARLDASTAEQTLSDQRAKDFKKGAKKIAAQLNQRAQELREQQAAHQREVQELRAEHRAALEGAEQKHRDELGQTELAHQQAFEQAAKHHQGKLDDALSKANAASEQALGKLEQQLESAVENHQALAREHDEQLTQLRSAHEQAISAAQAEAAGTAEATRRELNEKRQELDEQHAQHATAQQQRITALERELDEAHDRIEAAAKAASEVEQAHAKQLHALESEHANEISELRGASVTRQDELQQAHDKELGELRAAHDSAAAAAEEKLSSALAERDRQLKEQLEANAVQHAGETKRLKQEHERQVAEQAAAHTAEQAEIDSQQASAQQDCEQLREQLEDAKGREQEWEGHAAQLSAERDEMEERLHEVEEQVTTARGELETQLAAMRKAHEAQLEQARAKLAAAQERRSNDRAALGRARRALADLVAELPADDDADES